MNVYGWQCAQHKQKIAYKTNLRKIKFLGFHGIDYRVVLVKIFPLMYQLLMFQPPACTLFISATQPKLTSLCCCTLLYWTIFLTGMFLRSSSCAIREDTKAPSDLKSGCLVLMYASSMDTRFSTWTKRYTQTKQWAGIGTNSYTNWSTVRQFS